MKNLTELRTKLSPMFEELRTGATDVKVASEMNNTAGKIINTLKVQIEYAQLRDEKPTITYME
jgi:hypothetical protein